MAHTVFHQTTPSYGLAEPKQLGDYSYGSTPAAAKPAAGGFDVSSLFKSAGSAFFPQGIAADVAKAALNRPPPTSAAKLKNSMPVSINTGGINFGSIMQPYNNGTPANGADGMFATSPMASIGSASISSNMILYGAVGVGMIVLIMVIRR